MSQANVFSPTGEITLSDVAKSLLLANRNIKKKSKPDEYTKVTVSRAVSFFALAYEKLRNVIEFKDEHLVRRSAIERILKRRLALNPSAEGEGENLIRELLWARYFAHDSLSESDCISVQRIINVYLVVRQKLFAGLIDASDTQYLSNFLMQLLTCEIEEYLSPESSNRENIYTYFIFQVLKAKIKLEDTTPELQNAYLIASIEKTYRKTDIPYQRYHMFTVFYEQVSKYSEQDLTTLIPKLPSIFKKIDETLNAPIIDRLAKFVKKQLPPFLIIFEILKSKTTEEIAKIFARKEELWTTVDETCRAKYKATSRTLRALGVRSLIYIFATKMLLAIALEGPLSQFFYGHIDMPSIVINTIFPPLLMLLVLMLTKIPGADNTRRIMQRVEEIVDADPQFENRVIIISQVARRPRPTLQVGFTLFYVITFAVTLYLMWIGLDLLKFNLISKAIFIFFTSTVAFFAMRTRLVASEYRLIDRDTIFTPIIDFFFMPIVALGKFFSHQVGKINIFTFVFDVLIEAPFKLLIEIVEEWVRFTKNKKEEII